MSDSTNTAGFAVAVTLVCFAIIGLGAVLVMAARAIPGICT